MTISLKSFVQAFKEDGHLATINSKLSTSTLGTVNSEELDLAAMSLQQIEVQNMSDWEYRFHDLLVQVVECAYDRPIEAYTTFTFVYNLPSRWTHPDSP